MNYPNPGKQVSLRRADWRFLLPHPPGDSFQHLVLLDGPSGLAERLVEVGLARRVSCQIPREQSADALVILHDARAALRDAARCLMSGGVLYCEIDRRSPHSFACTPGRMQRALRDAGLSPTGIYWAIPNFDSCKRYIPLDVPQVLQWYFTTLFPALTPLDRLLEIAVRPLTKLNSYRLTPLVPCYSMTATAGPVRDVTPSVLGHPALPEELQKPGLRSVVLTSGYDDGSRVVMLPFAPGDRHPLAVLKVSRLANFNTNTEREQETLVAIRERLDATMRRTIPCPLGILGYGALTVGIESCAAGHSLVVSSGRWRNSIQQKIDDLRLTANWLGEFHRQAQISRLPWTDSAIQRWIETPLAAYTHAFGVTIREEGLFAAVRKRARSLVGTSLPIIWQHNDFGPWNLYRAGCELTVIDWEFGHDKERDRFGPALCDLLYFVTHWSYLVRRLSGEEAELRGFRELFLEPERGGQIAIAIHAVIREYLMELSIDQRYVPLLLVYTWIDRALDRFERQQSSGEGGTDTRFGNRYVSYIGILAAHTERLFANPAPAV